MKNVFLVLLTLLVFAGGGSSFYFYKEYKEATAEKAQLVQQNAELQVAIDAIGPITEVWTVNTEVFAGAVVKEEELVQQTIPVSSVTDSFMMDKSQIIGKYYKVDISPGVSITEDILMSEALDGITYERDLYFTYLPLGIKVGDYIDVRMVLPHGQEFVIIEHERVQQLVEETSVVKVLFNESQLALWTSALKDLALYGSKGLSIYVTKYIEPGITDTAVPYYPVRKEMENVVTLNPNIKDKSVCINSSLRERIDEMIAEVEDDEAGVLAGGNTQESSTISSTRLQYTEEQTGNAQGGGQQSGNQQGEGGSGSISDEQYKDSYDQIINLDPTDMDGNSAGISDSQVEDSRGDNTFSGEESIE